MAEIPVPRSYNEILGDMVDAFLSRYGLRALKVGSPVLSMLEATAQSQLRSTEDIFTLLEASSLDQAEGIALDRQGADESTPRQTQKATSGKVTITDTSFTKLSSKIFQGTSAPIVGSVQINVSDATLFPATGTVYIGRGTMNFEGPLSYTSLLAPAGTSPLPANAAGTSAGSYWTLVLATGTLRFHNLAESVVVGQGGLRSINPGTVVQTAQGNVVQAVQFKTLFVANIPDGETSISNVDVVALKPGSIGNISAGGIKEFSPPPFDGLKVTNPLPFTNGLPSEDDDTYRERIRQARQSRVKGTPLALQTAAIGVSAQDENKRVLSASVVSQSGQATVLYIDDGTGYEERTSGIAIESLMDLASGGEDFFKVSAARPIAKAFVLSTQSAPFVLASGAKLAVAVGGVVTEHTFDVQSFQSIDNATAYEVVASINSNATLLWAARTVNSGTQVAIFAKADVNEDVQVMPASGIEANTGMGFPTGRVDTMRLYKNDRLLTKDGRLAFVKASAASGWGSLSGDQSLTIRVDGILMAFGMSYSGAVTFPAFTSQDFIDADTGFTTVGANTPAAWAAVFNARIPGVTATSTSGIIAITSNKGRSSRAAVEIVAGSLVTSSMFAVQSAKGSDFDYIIDRNTGELKLTSALLTNDRLSAGSVNTRAFLESPALTTVSIPADARAWFAVDASAKLVGSAVTASTALSVTVPAPTGSKAYVRPWGLRARVASVTAADLFANVKDGDWAVFTDTAFGSLQGSYRAANVDAGGTYFDIELKAGAIGRHHHAVTVLNDGKLLITGGKVGKAGLIVTAAAELYNPATGAYTAIPPMSTPRAYHTSAILPSGKVLVAGGISAANPKTFLASAEIFDPSTLTWTTTASMSAARAYFASIAVADGTVLAVGGQTAAAGAVSDYLATTESYTESTGLWTAKASMATRRARFASALLVTNNIMVAGGENNGGVVAGIEKYNTAGNAWGADGALAIALRSLAGIRRSDNKVVIAGGSTTAAETDTASTNCDLYTEGAGTTPTAALPYAQVSAGIAMLADTKVILVGQSIPSGALVYDGASWTQTSAMLSNDPVTTADRKGARLVVSGGFAYAVGGNNPHTDKNWAVIEKYTTAAGWTVPSPYLTASTYLLQKGLSFVRTDAPLSKVIVPLDASYTAATLVPQLSLPGSTASLYRTTAYRLRTNTFNDVASGSTLAGDIALVAADQNGLKLALTPADATSNLTGHLASVESSNSELGTPQFVDLLALGTVKDESHLLVENANLLLAPGYTTLPGKFIVGSRSQDEEDPGFGQVKGFASTIASRQIDSLNADTLDLRAAPEAGWLPRSRLWAASPYALAADDTFTVLVDGDAESKRFTLNMWRALKPVGSTYGSSNTFKDADNGNQTLATAFGYTGGEVPAFDFDDFAVYMPARAKSDAADTARAVLWRYYRLGPDGNQARIHYTYPAAPASALACAVDNSDDLYTDISITLGSGALRTGYAVGSTYSIGQVATSTASGLTAVTFILAYKVLSGSRDGAGNVTLVLELPPGVNHTGWISGSGPFNFASASAIPSAGAFTLSANPTSSGGGVFDTITYNDGSALAIASIANPGVVYLTAGQTASLVGSTVAQYDFIRIETSATTNARFEGVTMRIVSDPAAHPYWVQMLLEESTVSPAVTDTVTQYTLGDTSALKIFQNLGQTATAIVSALNALAAADSRVPVKGTLISDGTGVINASTSETLSAFPSWHQLSDGVNYVSVTTPATSSVGDYSLLFKLPISSDLVTNSDWANETVRIVPRTAKNVVDWFAAPALSGLFTSADASLSSRAHKVQLASVTPGGSGSIQVQGGSANAVTAAIVGTGLPSNQSGLLITYNSINVTVPRAAASGMHAGSWCSVDNAVTLPRTGIINTGTSLQSLSLYGTEAQYILDAGTNLYTTRHAPFYGAQVAFERQGRFICVYDLDVSLAPLDLSQVVEGDWVRISTGGTQAAPGNIANVNTGIFKVVRVSNLSSVVTPYATADRRDCFWIENQNALEQSSTQCDITFFTPDSMMPGDVLSVSTDTWGSANRGKRTVTSVGVQRFDVAANIITRAGGIATCTTTTPHHLNVGDRISVTPGSSVMTASDSYYVASVPTSTSFTFSCAGIDGTVNTPQSFTGYPFQSRQLFQVDNTDESAGVITSASAALGTQSALVQVVEGKPARFIKQLLAIAPNQADGSFADLKFNSTYGFGHMSAAAGSVVTLLDKLAFSTDIRKGIDGYQHSIGLIGEVNRVIYGDPGDTATYPGVAAAGATVNIQGPLIKRIQVSISIRVRSGAPTQDIEDLVKSAVASVVNKAGVGQSISLSDLTTAASKVGGVVSAVMIKPVASAGSDLISVQAYEKPLVLNVDQDVLVSFVGA